MAEIIPRIPVKLIFPKGTVEINGVKYDKFVEITGGHVLQYLPMQGDTLTEDVRSRLRDTDPDYYHLNIVQHDGELAQHEVEAASRRKITNWIASKPTVGQKFTHAAQRDLEPFADHKILMENYVGFWVYDPSKPILFDERMSHFDKGRLNVQLLLNRPLRAQRPYVPPDLSFIKSICSEGFYLARGNCVVEQLWRCLKVRIWAGKDDLTRVTLLTKQELSAYVNESFDYRGSKSGPYPIAYHSRRGHA